MQYFGIDLHRKQMTVSLRNQNGDVLLRRQVSTRWPKLEEFRNQLHEAMAAGEKYVAVVEVCGFHDWLVQWLRQDEYCDQVLVVQASGPVGKQDRSARCAWFKRTAVGESRTSAAWRARAWHPDRVYAQ